MGLTWSFGNPCKDMLWILGSGTLCGLGNLCLAPFVLAEGKK